MKKETVGSYLALLRKDSTARATFLAFMAVRRGMRWLNQHARPGWHRNLFEPDRAVFLFRAHVGYENESPLALAFKHNDQYIDGFGYVVARMVARDFNLTHRQLELYGFEATYKNGKTVIPTEALDAAWERLLREQVPRLIPHRYYTPDEKAYRKRILEPSLFEEPRMGLFRRMFRTLLGLKAA